MKGPEAALSWLVSMSKANGFYTTSLPRLPANFIHGSVPVHHFTEKGLSYRHRLIPARGGGEDPDPSSPLFPTAA